MQRRRKRIEETKGFCIPKRISHPLWRLYSAGLASALGHYAFRSAQIYPGLHISHKNLEYTNEYPDLTNVLPKHHPATSIRMSFTLSRCPSRKCPDAHVLLPAQTKSTCDQSLWVKQATDTDRDFSWCPPLFSSGVMLLSLAVAVAIDLRAPFLNGGNSICEAQTL